MKALVTSINIEPDVYVLHTDVSIWCVCICVFMWFYFSHFLNSAKKYKPTSLSKEINMTQTRTFDWFLQDLTNKTQLKWEGFIWQAMELQIWIQNYQPVSFMWTVLTTLEYSSNNPGRNSGKTDVERIWRHSSSEGYFRFHVLWERLLEVSPF